MSDYKPVKIKRKKRLDSKFIKLLVFRIIPIALVAVISVCGFSIFDKKISEIIANKKYTDLAERGLIDDPTSDNYDIAEIDWLSQYNTLDPNGFDPLALSPLGLSSSLRPSSILDSSALERALGYVNKQSKVWSIHDSINSDIIAWIYMYGMGINYPIAEDPANSDFYLTHSYDKTRSTSGTLFMSSASSINPLSRNVIIHGHNMRDGTMFATLNNYLKGTKAYYDSHKYIFLDTLYGTYRYEIYSVYKTKPDDIYLMCGFGSNAAFLNWCDETNQKGIYKSDSTSFNPYDRILTLSTCDATGKSRIIVHAKMVYPIPVDDVEFYYPDDSAFSTPEVPEGFEPEELPTSAPTAAPVATPQPTDSFATGSVYRVSLTDVKSTLRLRSGPGTNSSVVTGLAHGTKVTVISTDGSWVKVKTDGGMEGYLQKEKLIPDSQFAYSLPNGSVGAPTKNIVTPQP